MAYRKLLRAISAVALTWLLAGCAERSVRDDFSFDKAKNEGIVIVSASHDESGGRRVQAEFYLDKSTMHMISSLPDVVPGIPGGSDFDNDYGKVYVLSLPAGRHEFSSWHFVSGTVIVGPKEKPTPLSFDVVANQVKYLGNLHAHLLMGENIFGISILGSGYPVVRDEGERDLAIVAEKYPQLKDKVTIDLLKRGPWISSWETTRDVITLPPPVPIRK